MRALHCLGLDEVWWLVSPQNPLKSSSGMAPLTERLKAAQNLAQHPHVRVTALEQHWGTQFTADTLRVLRKRFPRCHFVWLMGADNLRQISRWNRWISIFESVAVAVFDRSPYSYRALAGRAARRFAQYRLGNSRALGLLNQVPPAWIFLHTRRHPASATAIRRERKNIP